MRRLISVLMLVSGLVIAGGNANAAAVFTIEEVGADIRVTASGTLNTTGLTLVIASTGPGWGVLDPNIAFITVGPPQASGVNYAYYSDPITGPASFGNSSSFLGASSTTNSSSIVGFSPAEPAVYTPVGFVSGSAISGSSTFAGQSYTSLGLTQGQSYTYTLANNETITVQIGSAAPTPTVTAVNPTSGSTAGGETITITGTNFANGATVNVGTAACTNVNVVSATSITCTTPPGTAGPASVEVTVGGQTNAANTLFSYLDVPTLSINNPSVTYTGSAIPATVSCSSGGAVTNVKYNGISTVPTNAGTYAVTANCAANSNYSALTDAAAGNFEITTATQTLTLSPATANVNAGVGQALTLSGAQGTGQVTYNVSSSGAVTCTLSNESNTGVTVTGNNGAGTCSVTASIVADNNYRAAMSNTAIVSVNLVPQTGFTLNLSITSVTTNTPVNLSTTGGEGNGGVTYTAEAQGVQPSSIQNLSATTQSILQCNINGTILTPTGGTGVCVVTAVKAADGNYAAASSTGNVTVRATPAPNPIPTLSEWAQIMMMLAMIATAGFYGWRMKQR